MAYEDSEELYSISYLDSYSHVPRRLPVHRPTRMPCQTPSWTEFLICPICTNEFAANLRVPITLRCGHSICKKCLASIQQCPYDQSPITKDLDHLPINFALLQLTSSGDNNNVEHEILPSIVQKLSAEELQCYKLAKSSIEELALYLKPNGNSVAGLFSRPMQRKLVTLINCQLVEDEGRTRSLRAARSLGERTVTELILQHQNPQQLSANLWAAVRARGCQFLGPAMQEEVLKLVLLALEDGVSLCRKVLVMFVVQRLEPTFPQASKTSIGHVVQLLYRASCFIVSKRDGDSSLMQLKEEFRSYKSLRKEHDAQIVQIATEAGLRIAPDQWSALLYGDPDHKSDMQSLIDKQQSPQSFGQSVQELMIALQRTNDPANLSALRGHLNNLAAIDASPDSNVIPSWKECADAVDAVKHVVNGLVEFMQNHGSRKSQESGHLSHANRYKISFCRDLNIKGNCPRGSICTFAHTDEELERYRAKMKKPSMRQPIKGPVNYNGPNPKVNICQPPQYGSRQEAVPPRFSNKSMPYRSENNLHQTPVKTSQHLMPTYPNNNSSSSTPNLSQTQLSPKMMSAPPAQQMNSRFTFNDNYGYSPNYVNPSPPPQMGQHQKLGYHQGFRPPPISSSYMKASPSGYSSDYKRQFSPYHSPMPPMPSPMMKPHSGYFTMPPPLSRNEDYSNNNNNNGDGNKHQINWRSGIVSGDKMKSVNKSPNHLMPMSKSPMSNDSNQTSPINRSECSQMEMNRAMQRNSSSDEVDGLGIGKMWISSKNQPAFQFNNSQAKDNFIRSDSILTSNTDDEFSFDSMNFSGSKYGPIGIKNQPMESNSRQWSGLNSAMPKRYDGPGSSSADANNIAIQRMNSNGNGNRQIKANFLSIPFDASDMNTSAVTSTPRTPMGQQARSVWNENISNWGDGPQDFDLTSEDSLGINGMSTIPTNLWELINQ